MRRMLSPWCLIFCFVKHAHGEIFPNDMIISRDAYAWRKSLTVYDSDCNQIATVQKICTSWHNDVQVEDGDGNVLVSTNFNGVFDSNLDVYKTLQQSGDNLSRRITAGYWDRVASQPIYGGDVSMLVLNPKDKSGGGDGTTVGQVDGQNILEKELRFQTLDGRTVITANDNAWNGRINPCRSKNALAQGFFTVAYTDNATGVISREDFVGAISTIILNLADNDLDSCSQWNLYGVWILVALCALVVAIVAFVFIRSARRYGVRRTLRSWANTLFCCCRRGACWRRRWRDGDSGSRADTSLPSCDDEATGDRVEMRTESTTQIAPMKTVADGDLRSSAVSEDTVTADAEERGSPRPVAD